MIRFGAIAAAALAALTAAGELNKQQLEQYQLQQMQQQIQQSLGPAAGMIPTPGSGAVEDGLWGHAGDILKAVDEVQNELQEQAKIRGISAAVLAGALPPAIKDFRQVDVESESPGDASEADAIARSVTASVIATYENRTRQEIKVTLMDTGIFSTLATEEGNTEAEPMSVETDAIILQVKEIEGYMAHIQYDRSANAGTLVVRANRVSVTIDGQGVPFGMLEVALGEIGVKKLAQLGGPAPRT